MTRVLYVHPGREMSGFVASDFRLLAERFGATALPWTRLGDARAVRRALRGHDAVLTWFLSHHAAVCAFLARRQGKPSIAVTSSEEVTPPALLGEPPWRLKDRWATSYAFNRSDLVLTGSRCTLQEAMLLRRPRARSEVRHVPLAVDAQRFQPRGPKEGVVVSACVMSAASARRKRIGLLVEAARELPGVQVVIPGKHHDDTGRLLAARAPPNVSIPGALPDEAYLALLQRAKVYVQASIHEGFGISNAEAMACGCVPVVARTGALPEVVGDAGFYLDEPPSAKGLAEAVRRAMASDLGANARARILAHYDVRQRGEALARAVEDAVQGRLRPGLREPG